MARGVSLWQRQVFQSLTGRLQTSTGVTDDADARAAFQSLTGRLQTRGTAYATNFICELVSIPHR